jgi:hypothetical protein
MKNKEPENDIPKYKKKTKSNCSKSNSKSDHKHQNKDCLLIVENRPYLGSYCTVCGKIRGWNYCLEKCEGGYRELPKEEVYSKYKDLEQIAIILLLVIEYINFFMNFYSIKIKVNLMNFKKDLQTYRKLWRFYLFVE